MPAGRRLLVIGGGISGLAAARSLTALGDVEVELWEADERLGGKLATSPFAGLPAVDEGADAYLVRVPHAVAFANAVGLDDAVLTAPTAAGAAVWHNGLHPIPEGIVLGVPGEFRKLAATRLISWRGKLRAALEPLLPATDAGDSIGQLIRARFGDEVHERLVDALVGSIYATDTDHSSLASVPQLAGLAARHRSLLIAARRVRREAPPTGAPIFAAPRGGMRELVAAAQATIAGAGGHVTTGRSASELAADGDGWRVDGERFDGVVIATPAAHAAQLLRVVAPQPAAALDGFETAGVIIVRLAVAGQTWPRGLHGRSGYLVPKPDQRTVTAVSFGSQKWAHWNTPDGTQVLRVSLGRDGLPVDHLDDDEVARRAVDEVSRHLGLDLQPTHLAITRWPGAFPQYRPHHAARVTAAERDLPGTIALAGASYRGIGIPACIADGERATARVGAR